MIAIGNACEATDASLTTKSVNADAPECKPGQARHAASLGKESTGAVRSYDGRRAECERRLYLSQRRSIDGRASSSTIDFTGVSGLTNGVSAPPHRTFSTNSGRGGRETSQCRAPDFRPAP